MTESTPNRWRVVIIAADGRRLHWRKADKVHTLSWELGPTWIANFKRAVFQVMPDGSLVPRGQPGAADIAAVELEAAPA
jgi:hypothetical protein